mgnify:CR=1 FL=1
MKNNKSRIVHYIVHPIVEDYDISYMVIMFVENGKIMHVTYVKLKENFISFNKIIPNIYYAFSAN